MKAVAVAVMAAGWGVSGGGSLSTCAMNRLRSAVSLRVNSGCDACCQVGRAVCSIYMRPLR